MINDCKKCNNEKICKWKEEYEELQKKLKESGLMPPEHYPFRITHKCDYFIAKNIIRADRNNEW